MGIYYTKINKIFESEIIARYEFDSEVQDCTDVGILEINKNSGDCTIVEAMPGDTDNKLAIYACMKLAKHWQKGEFPDETFCAS